MSDIREWLEKLSLGQYADAFEDIEVGITLIPSFDHDVLKDKGISATGLPTGGGLRASA